MKQSRCLNQKAELMKTNGMQEESAMDKSKIKIVKIKKVDNGFILGYIQPVESILRQEYDSDPNKTEVFLSIGDLFMRVLSLFKYNQFDIREICKAVIEE